MQQGDVVTQVNHKPVNNIADFNAAVKAGGANGSTLLLVQRGGVSDFLAVNR